MQDQLAPIALFLYNRPEHTKRVLNSLKKNDLVEKSILYVFCDGPKSNITTKEKENIDQVRNLVDEVDFTKQVVVTISKHNQGLAKSVSLGVQKVLESHDSIIVIEDDLQLSKGFLRFMNTSLSSYVKNDKIMHIGAYFPPLNGDFDPLVLMQLTHSWGWATWKDRWQFLNQDSGYLLSEIWKRGLIRQFNYENTFNFYRMLRRTHQGTRDSWLILWYASIFLKGGLCLNPTRSLVSNFGHDNTGTHSYRTKSFESELHEAYNWEYPNLTTEDLKVRKALKVFFWRQKFMDGPNYYLQLLISKIKRILNK